MCRLSATGLPFSMHRPQCWMPLQVRGTCWFKQRQLSFYVLNLVRTTGAGLNGLLDPVEPGLACGSDTAHLSLLGYEPRRCVLDAAWSC